MEVLIKSKLVKKLKNKLIWKADFRAGFQKNAVHSAIIVIFEV